jgi:hypothetical protein
VDVSGAARDRSVVRNARLELDVGDVAAVSGRLRSVAADDVTDQVADLDGRLASQRAGVVRIRALLDKATSVGDVVLIESELTQREADLGRSRGGRRGDCRAVAEGPSCSAGYGPLPIGGLIVVPGVGACAVRAPSRV